MLAETHKLIARYIYEALQRELNIDLNYNSFRHGSVAPDIYPFMLFMDHTPRGTMNLVERYMDQLSGSIWLENDKMIDKFSFKLGVVIHFVADYFCEAHNAKRYKNLFLHFAYERRLRDRFKRHMEKFIPLSVILNAGGWEIEGSLRDYITRRHNEYNSIKHSLYKDINYSLTVSMLVALNIAQRCLVNSDRTYLEKTA